VLKEEASHFSGDLLPNDDHQSGERKLIEVPLKLPAIGEEVVGGRGGW
jgi:hypothetical protein